VHAIKDAITLAVASRKGINEERKRGFKKDSTHVDLRHALKVAPFLVIGIAMLMVV